MNTGAIHLYVGDRVRVQMAGWTSGKADGIPGSDDYYVAVRDDLAVIGNSTWLSGSWEEGCCYEAHRAGFLNSTLVLTALQYIRAGTTVEVIVPRQQLRPQCGMPGPYVNQTMSVRRAGQRVYEYVKKAYPETTLDVALTDSATSVTLATGGAAALGPPVANSYILIGSEVLLVTAVSTNALTVTRAQHGTNAAAHLDGAKVFLLKDTLDHTMEIDSSYVSGVEVVAPRSIDEANAIGDGCKSLGFCTGKGECDHCTSTCRCPHAHRAVDNSYTSYSCEAINCPTGMAPTGVEIGAPSSRRIWRGADIRFLHRLGRMCRGIPEAPAITRGPTTGGYLVQARASARPPANAVVSQISSARRASGGSVLVEARKRATARATARARR